jgi:protein O-mannosyl-transferase
VSWAYGNQAMNKTVVLSQIWKYITITILVVAAYFPTFSGDFILDDKALVKNNPFITESHTIAEYFNQEDGIVDKMDLGNYHSGYYRPLINMTFRLDYKLWGMNAAGFRITNVILHILCCFMLLKLFALLLDKQTAFWITIIFALHPVNTEAVSFIVSRNNIIVTFFILASFYFYIISWERKNYLSYILSLFLFSGAIFSKEFGLMVIPLLFLYQRILSRQKYELSKELISYIPFIIIAFLYLLLRKGVTDSVFTPSNIESIWSRIYFTPFIVLYNLKLILLPHELHFIDLNYPANIFNWQSNVSFLLFLSICLALWMLKKDRLLTFSILAFLVCIFPTLNIIPTPCISLIGMRWLYVSMGFLLIGGGLIIEKAIIARRNIVVSLLIITITYLGGYTYILNRGLWHDDDTFMKQEVLGFSNYLFASDIAEKYFNNKQYPEAEVYFKIAIEKFPYQAFSYINLSALYIETGRPEVAVLFLNKAKPLVMTHHEQGEWYNNMGMALFKMGEKEKGLKHLRKAVIAAPDEPVFWANLGGVYGMIGDYNNSINAFKKGICISPETVELRTNLALTYINLKSYQEAISVLEGIPEKEVKENAEVLRLLRQARVGMRNNGSYLDISKKSINTGATNHAE